MSARILVADDDPDLRQLVRLMLQREGYDVIEAVDGEQALARAADSDPSLILLDILMPGGMDGFDACRRLKSDGRTRTVPVIFITALNDLRNHEEGLKLGADAYLVKPIDPSDLSRRVRSAIQRRAIRLLFDSARGKTGDRGESRRVDDAFDSPRWSVQTGRLAD
jgi:DNA-binding response OmpR family regulator